MNVVLETALSELAKNPHANANITKSKISELIVYLYDNFLKRSSAEQLRYSLYAGIIIRISHDHLSTRVKSSDLSKLYDIAGAYMNLEDFAELNPDDFYADPFTVVLENIKYLYDITSMVDMAANKGLQLLAHKYCDSYQLMLDEIGLVTKKFTVDRYEAIVGFVIDFPFRYRLAAVGVSPKGVDLTTKKFIKALLFLHGIVPSKSAQAEQLSKKLKNSDQIVQIINSCNAILLKGYSKISEEYIINFMPVIVFCLRKNGMLNEQLKLLATIKNKFSKQELTFFDSLLIKDVQSQDYEPEILAKIYDENLSLHSAQHLLNQIIELFIIYKKESKIKSNMYLINLTRNGKDDLSFEALAALWKYSGNHLNLDPNVRKNLACMQFGDKNSILELSAVIRDVLTISELTYKCDFNVEGRLINKMTTKLSLHEAINHMLMNLTDPRAIARFTIQPVVKSQHGFSWFAPIHAIIQRMGKQEWSLFDLSSKQIMDFTCGDVPKVSKLLMRIIHKHVNEFAHKYNFDEKDIQLVQIPLTFYSKKSNPLAMLQSYRRSQTTTSFGNDKTANGDYRELPLIKSPSMSAMPTMRLDLV